MAKRGRRRGGFKKAKTNLPSVGKTQPSNATSFGNFGTPKIHPASNDCYPLNKLCRLCLLSNNNMEPIFPYPGDKRLAEKILQCTNLEIKENPEQGIPNSICGQCKKQLDQCYEFRLLCWKNDEILHNLHAILSPQRKTPYQQQQQPQLPIQSPSRSNPVVQVQKMNLSSIVTPRRGRMARKSFGEVPLSQLYTPSRFGHMRNKPQFTRELVVRLTPISSSLINKYKKAAAAKKVTQTKAAMKSFPQPVKARGRPAKVIPKAAKARAPIVKAKIRIAKPKAEKKQTKAKASKAPKASKTPKVSKAATAAALKKHKAKRADSSVPPKKRKQNFETAPPTVATATCVLCTQTFTSVKSLGRHMATHENSRKNNRVFNCDICKKEYLKGSHFAEHLDSAEHLSNAARNDADESGLSILPDGVEPEVSILPDDDGERIVPDEPSVTEVNVSLDSSVNQEPEPEPEEITDELPPAMEERQQPSPDETNDNTQQDEPSQLDESAEPEDVVTNDKTVNEDEPTAEVVNVDRDPSPIPVESESSRSREGAAQFDEPGSTNENLFNGNGSADASNASRRVTFSDITEIVE